MKILVTGGAGFIGCNFVRYLLDETDAEVLVVDKLTYAANQDVIAELETHSRFHFEQGDIVCASFMEDSVQRFQPDAIVHLAAESHVDHSIRSPEEFIQTNIVGTYRMLTVARRYAESPSCRGKQFRFLHASTDEVYGSLSENGEPFTEETRYAPRSPYSASKASADHLVRAWHQTYGLPVLITNSSNNYGPFQFPEKLIPVVVSHALNGEPIPVYGDGKHIRNWLHVNDHAKALFEVVQRGRVGETYNIGGSCELQNIELVRNICQILDELLPVSENAETAHNPRIQCYFDLVEFVEDRPGHDLRYSIDTSKIRSELGWKPDTDFNVGLRKTIEWYIQHRNRMNQQKQQRQTSEPG